MYYLIKFLKDREKEYFVKKQKKHKYNGKDMI